MSFLTTRTLLLGQRQRPSILSTTSASRFLAPSTSTTSATTTALLLRSNFHISRVRRSLNEADRHDDHEKIKRDTDHHKNDQLQKRKEGKGHWTPELASQSEAAVKADRAEIEASDESIKGLQKETLEGQKKG